jgi:hypothetical protein
VSVVLCSLDRRDLARSDETKLKEQSTKYKDHFQERYMAHTFEELKHKTVAELREIAKGIEHEAVQGYTQLNKEHLLVAISKALGIKHEHHEVVGVDKASIKARIREMKTKREAALSAHDHAELKTIRRTIHRLKRQIHKATV